MPGIHLVCELGVPESRDLSALRRASDPLLYGPEYRRTVLHERPQFWLACTRYPAYPVCLVETEEFLICVDGTVYPNGVKLGEMVLELARCVFEPCSTSRDRVAKWLLGTDGDFVIVLHDRRTGQFAILNDAQGRVPLFYSVTPQRVVVSREAAFVAALASPREFDRSALAEELVVGSPLEARGVRHKMARVRAGTLLRIWPERSTLAAEEVQRSTVNPPRLARADGDGG